MKILLVLVFLFTFNFCLAQETPSTSEFGVKAGVNINDLGGKDALMYTSIGFHLGAYYEVALSSAASIQPEFVLSLQGAALDLNKDFRLNYYYLNIPVVAKFYFADNFTVEAGPQYGFLAGASQTSPFGNINISEDVQRHDISIVFGIGYKLNTRTGLTLRYNLGLSNTNNQNVVYSERLTNRVLMISLNYIL